MVLSVKKKAAKPTLRLDQRLALFRYFLALFGVDPLEDLARDLKDPEYECTDEENVTKIARVLALRFHSLDSNAPPGPSTEDLLRYDANIVRHTARIGASRDEPIRWKYFQYLSLLFAEIYLDRWFTDAEALLDSLNAFTDDFNSDLPNADEVDEYLTDDLRKVAFWMATGSGKTLLMHVNILQYLHYLEHADRRSELNRIILLTPNEGLSGQHLKELRLSGIDADLFNKDAPGPSLFSSVGAVEIIDIHKLADDMGDKTVAVDAFEGNNLVLVDEGHRGSGGEDWKGKRDRLCENGFSFEYSATFGQAVKAAAKADLAQEYAKCILFDYSYRWFYDDGYGKDYQILNLDSVDPDTEHRYLTAGLLAFYQQLLVYENRSDAFVRYGLERPLWVFVGGSVTATTSAKEKSDIQQILSFIARFLRERDESVALLDRLMSGSTGITYKGKDVFAGRFPYLNRLHLTGEDLYGRIRSTVFNAAGGTQIRVEELKSAPGELSLSVGNGPSFGVINVGDAPGLRKLLEDDPTFSVGTNEFTPSLFDTIDSPTSRVHFLLGSRKFTEGWNSWRVSSMGLMNIGRTEGAQIIQLFGRGVRLRGLDNSLKRSAVLTSASHPEDIRLLETLNVFGVHASYIQKFKEYLQDEGLSPDQETVEVIVPVQSRSWSHPLKSIRIRGGGNFKRDERALTLGPPPSDILSRPVALDWYPKIQALDSGFTLDVAAVVETPVLSPTHLAFMDLDSIWFQLVADKNERGRTNLTIPRAMIDELLCDPTWYVLKIPAAELSFPSTGLARRVRTWEDIALALLKKYVDRWYRFKRNEWEAPRREYYPLTAEDRSFIREYRFEVPFTRETLIDRLREVQWTIELNEFEPWTLDAVELFAFDRHLFQPLVHTRDGADVEVKPTALNLGERDFVFDLLKYHASPPPIMNGKTLYLLRNPSRLGVGFFEAGNFYPDFILWIIDGDCQYITFVDPKGIARMTMDDDKIRFFETVKDVERSMNDPNVVLNSFIISNTRYAALAGKHTSKAQYEAGHVLFQVDDRPTYIYQMVAAILQGDQHLLHSATEQPAL